MNIIKEKCKICNAEIAGFGGQHFNKNKFFHYLNMHNVNVSHVGWEKKLEGNEDKKINVETVKEIKENVKEADEKIKKVSAPVKIDFEKLTKDELNDYAAKQGFEKEIQPKMKKETIINKLKKLMSM